MLDNLGMKFFIVWLLFLQSYIGSTGKGIEWEYCLCKNSSRPFVAPKRKSRVPSPISIGDTTFTEALVHLLFWIKTYSRLKKKTKTSFPFITLLGQWQTSFCSVVWLYFLIKGKHRSHIELSVSIIIRERELDPSLIYSHFFFFCQKVNTKCLLREKRYYVNI